MQTGCVLALTLWTLTSPSVAVSQGGNVASDYPIRPAPFNAVRLNDGFWAPRLETNRTVTIPVLFDKCQETGRVALFERAAQALRGEQPADRKPPGFPFDDTDVYKSIEAASYALHLHQDPRLKARVDELIGKIRAAQEPDGYLFATRTIDPANPHPWAGKQRWELERVDSHELYNLGHLFEAATAHYEATGDRSLLEVALKGADLLVRTFGPGKQAIWPGHQGIEMGLARLFRVTAERRYLELARFMLDVRGPDGLPGSGRTYNQSHLKVTEQGEAVGHAVRATYMYAGMADVAALTGEGAYLTALERIWQNVVGGKLYLTGGVGARGAGEAFGQDYELPNMSAYAETCAAVGNLLWNYRLFLRHGDARYADVMERILYNGLLSGISLDGRRFFYTNPLESKGQHERSPWFRAACCPPNVSRVLASMTGYIYATRGQDIYVNLFAAGQAQVKLGNGRTVRLTQQTRYPWEGTVRLIVDPDRRSRFALLVRVPGWARNQPVPSGLYRFADGTAEPPAVLLNGNAIPLELSEGYARVERSWNKGDTIELRLPMPVRRIVADERVAAARGRVALQRGPVVYAVEWPDNPNRRVRHLLLPHKERLASEFRPDLLNGVAVLRGKALALSCEADGQVRAIEQEFTAIPYYAWANRGRGEMLVWIPCDRQNARPLPCPTIATTSKVTASGRKDPSPINDGEEPRSSDDPDSYFDWWPTRGTTEWVQYDFAKPATVSECAVYWFDDTGRGQVRVPASWRILYREAGQWKPVEPLDPYGTARDQFNRVRFRPVATDGLRLEVTMQPNWSAGIQEWKVN